jgi:hypothetical protein
MNTLTKEEMRRCIKAMEPVAKMGGTVTMLASAAGLTVKQLMQRINRYPEFSAMMERVLELAKAEFEAIGVRAARGGVKGHSSATYIKMLASRYPGDYATDSDGEMGARIKVIIGGDDKPEPLPSIEPKEIESGQDCANPGINLPQSEKMLEPLDEGRTGVGGGASHSKI